MSDFAITIDGATVEYTVDTSSQGGIDHASGQTNSRQTVVYWVPFADRINAKLFLLGPQSIAVNGSGTKYISRTPPHSIPWEGGNGWLYANNVTKTDNKGQRAKTGSGPEFLRAYLAVTYEGLPYEVMEDAAIINPANEDVDESLLMRWVTPTPTDKTRILQVKEGSYEWASDADPSIGFTPAKKMFHGSPLPLYEQEWVIDWHAVPRANIPWATIAAAQNKSNSVAFGIDGSTMWPIGTIAFMGMSSPPTFGWLPNGVKCAKLAYKFRHQPEGVNSFPDPARQNQMKRVVAPGTPPHYPFDPADLRGLFRPA